MTSTPLLPLLSFSWILLAILAAAVFGGNGTVSAPALACTALFLTAATLTSTSPRQKWPLLPLLAIGMVMAWAALQTLPWTTLGNPLWAQAGMALGQTLPATISINPAGTQYALAQGATYAGVFLSIWLLAQRGRTASQLLKLLALSGVAIAAAGLTMFAAGNNFIWNFPKPAYLNDLTATFVNRNTYATFAGLTVLLNLAVALERWGELPSGRRTPWRQRAQSFLNLILLPRWGYFAGAGIAFIALMLTHSRAGIVCSMLGIVVMLSSLFLQRRPSPAATVSMGLLLALGFMATFSMLGDATSQRLAKAERDSTERATLYAITAEAIYATPYTGSGLGTFEETFRTARTPDLNLHVDTRVDHAHNTWLQMALELGLPAFSMLLLAVGWLLAQLLSGLGERRRGITYPALGLGAAALLATHGLVDFSLQIPGVTYTAIAILALALAQSKRKLSEDAPAPSRLPGLILAVLTLPALAILVPATWAAYQTSQAQTILVQHQKRTPAVSTAQLVEARTQLLPYAKRYGTLLTLSESALTERAKPNQQITNAYRMQVWQHATMALAQAPANPYTWHRLAAAQFRLGNLGAAASAMAMSLLTGPFEPNLLWQRLPLLTALMPHFTPDDKAFAQSIMHKMWVSKSHHTWHFIKGNPVTQSMVATAIAHDAEAVKLWEKVSRKPFPLAINH